MTKISWFERQFNFGSSPGVLPFLLERLEGTISRLEAKVAGLSEKILSEQLDGKWSVKQNIRHLAQLDDITLGRMEELKNGVSTISLAVFEPHDDYNSKTIGEVLKNFNDSRRRKIDKFRSLSENDLIKTSIHPRFKISMNVVDLALFGADHDDHHLVRINEIIQTLNR